MAGSDAPGPGHVLAVRPEHIEFVEGDGVECRVISRQFLGTIVEWWIELDGETMRAWLRPEDEYRDGMKLSVLKSGWVLADDA